MTSYKVCLVLAATIITVNANFHYEHFKTFSFQGDDGDNLRKPWFFDDHATPYRQASSDVVPNYGSPYGHSAGVVGLAGGEEDHYSNPAEALFAAATKKVPNEDKSFKKAISPFYTLTDKDDAKYKDVVLKLGVPYCTETKSKTKRSLKSDQKRYGRNAMTCYKCKDPKNGATYEQCSYSSKPQASTRVESFVPIPSSFRYRRSNIDDDDDDDDEDGDGVHKGAEATDGIKGQYRFGDEFFQPEASHEIPASYKKDAEKCEKVVKDSMVCMVCTDVKTNAKYEQCSYVARPNEKAYSYAKSSSFPKPTAVKPSAPKADDSRKKYENRESEESSRPKADYGAPTSSLPSYDYSTDYSREPRSSAESKKSSKTESAPRYGSGESGVAAAEGKDDKGSQEAGSESPQCKKVNRDSMTCTVCKDPKTGGNYEQCSYAYQPNDKVYQFSKSNSFGYPEGAAPGQQGHRGEDKSGEESAPSYQEYEGPSGSSEGYSKPASSSHYGGDDDSGSHYGQGEANNDSHDYYSQPSENSRESSSDGGYEPSSSEYVQSESEKIAEKAAKGGDCKKVQKDSMTCTVCKDPKTGGNSEQCSYSFEPSDKVFSFSTAKSFGSPTSETKGDREGGEEQSSSYQVPDYSVGYDFPSQEESKPYASESQTYAATDDTERAVKPIVPFVEDSNAEAAAAAKLTSETDEPVTAGKAKTEFFDTSKKKAEIEKFLQDFQSEDRSKCKKIMRDKMTCYQCTDDKGFQKEECMFVAAPQPKNNRLAYHEVKEFKVDPAAATDPSKVTAEATSANKKTIAAESDVPLEPTASASETHTRRAAPDDEEAEEEEEDGRQRQKEEGDEEGVEIKHDEPDDFATVTRPVFDKKLGLTLPAYMLVTSEHEQEFDEVVASTRS